MFPLTMLSLGWVFLSCLIFPYFLGFLWIVVEFLLSLSSQNNLIKRILYIGFSSQLLKDLCITPCQLFGSLENIYINAVPLMELLQPWCTNSITLSTILIFKQEIHKLWRLMWSMNTPVFCLPNEYIHYSFAILKYKYTHWAQSNCFHSCSSFLNLQLFL